MLARNPLFAQSMCRRDWLLGPGPENYPPQRSRHLTQRRLPPVLKILATDTRSRFQVRYAAFQIVSIVIRRSSANISRVEARQVTEFNA
jgi:hypothetical protein